MPISGASVAPASQATVTSVPSRNAMSVPASPSVTAPTAERDIAPASSFRVTSPALRSSMFCASSGETGFVGGGTSSGPLPESLSHPPSNSAQAEITSNFFIMLCI